MTVLYSLSLLLFCFAVVLGKSGSPAQFTGDSFNSGSTGSGYAFTNGSSGSGDEHLHAFVPPGAVVVEDEPQCDWCTGRHTINQCQTGDHPGCKCDGKCGLYGDCCADHPLICEPPDVELEKDPVFSSMECNTVYYSGYTTIYAETYWMVARCPVQVGLFVNIQKVVNDRNFGSTIPVTDENTGIVYKNEFCALCHSVTSFTRWSFTYSCREEFKDLLNTDSVPLKSLLESCTPCRYVIPTSVYSNSTRELLPPRRCVVHVSSCLLSYKEYLLNCDKSLLLLEEQFENAVYHCHNGPYNAIGAVTVREGMNTWNEYRNIHCALCNGAAVPNSIQCTQYSTIFMFDLCLQNSILKPGNEEPRPINFGLLLDVNKDGATTITTTETVTSLTQVDTACFDNEVFDPSIGECREIVCPPGYFARRGSCVDVSQGLLPPTKVAPDQTLVDEIGSEKIHPDQMPDQRIASDDPGNKKESLDTTQSSPTLSLTHSDSDISPTFNCYLVTLMKGCDNFTINGNDSVVYEGVTVTVVAFDDSHNPTICSPFISSNNASHTHSSYLQKIKQIAPTFFLVPSLMANLITICLQLFLRKLHSMYGSVIVNLAVTLLLSDLFLLSIYHSVSSLDIFYFLWHTSSLAVACWVCIFIVHITLAFRKSCNSHIIGFTFSQKTTLTCVYFTFGWGPALVVALIKNEMYSEWGPCLHDSLNLLCEPTSSSLTFFIVPLLIAIIFCASICVLISVKAVKSPQPLDKKIMYRFYVFLVLLVAFTMGWIFGFMYLLSPSPLISTVAFFIFLSLKLATVLSFLFGLVFSKKARNVLHKSFGQKNIVQPLPQNLEKAPQIRVEVPTLVAVSDKTQDPLI